MPRDMEAPLYEQVQEAYKEITGTTFNPDEVVPEAINTYEEITGTTFNPGEVFNQDEEISKENLGKYYKSYESLTDNTREKKFIFRFMETLSFKTKINKDEVKINKDELEMLIALDYEIYKARGDPSKTKLEKDLKRQREVFMESLETKYDLSRNMRTTLTRKSPNKGSRFADNIEQAVWIPSRRDRRGFEEGSVQGQLEAIKEAARAKKDAIAQKKAKDLAKDLAMKAMSFFNKCGLKSIRLGGIRRAIFGSQPYALFNKFSTFLTNTIYEALVKEEEDDTEKKYRIQEIVRSKIRMNATLTTGEIELLASIFLCDVLMIEAEEESKEIKTKIRDFATTQRFTIGRYGGGVNVLGMYGGRPLFGKSKKKSPEREQNEAEREQNEAEREKNEAEREQNELKGYRKLEMCNKDIMNILYNIQIYLDSLDSLEGQHDEISRRIPEILKHIITYLHPKETESKMMAFGRLNAMKDSVIAAAEEARRRREQPTRVPGGGYRKTRRKTRKTRKTKRKTQRRNQRKTKRKTKKIIKDRTKSKRSTSKTRRKRR